MAGSTESRKRPQVPQVITELMAVVDLFSGFNKLIDGLQVEPDEKPWYGLRSGREDAVSISDRWARSLSHEDPGAGRSRLRGREGRTVRELRKA